MIKTKSLLLTIILSIVSTGCINNFQVFYEKAEQTQTKENMPLYSNITDKADENILTALFDEDFIVMSKDIFIELKGNYDNLITNEKIARISYLDENHVYDTYVYENFIVSV
ncbi:hypothetical protein ABFV83_12435 [Lacrimispora sp. BS-2]|uniref:DUF4440 domain-containing protein n=1 Tax=Lacrimispora sp. BS-2 TaxID=3151850 RepID=A0AAU7PJT5_9FIRM